MNKSIKQFLKVLLVFLLCFCIIIPNAEIWNMTYAGYTDTFHVIVSIVDFIAEVGLLYYFTKHCLFKKEETV